jgi:thymidylate synthase (FAD)
MMLQGGYVTVDPSKFHLVDAGMRPVPLNPEARYLISAGEHSHAGSLASELRFGCRVSDLLTNEQVSDAEAAASSENTGKVEGLRPGDMLAVHNCGFIEYMDVMGTDDDIAGAARTSYTGGKQVQKNQGLLRYLLRHHHTTPFEMSELKFRIYLPIFIYRQLFRHRTANQLEPEVAECISNDTAFQTFSVQNEMSGRYVEMPDHYYLPEPASVQLQSTDNKQGRAIGLTPDEQQQVRERFASEIKRMREWYGSSISQGLAKELARAQLPLSQYTLLIWKIDLKNLLHFIRLRIHPHAQYEVREYARALLAVVRTAFPITAAAFDDYELGAVRFSRSELESLLEQMSPAQREAAMAAYRERVKNGREQLEFAEKLGLDGSTPA